MDEALFERKVQIGDKEFSWTKEEWDNCMMISPAPHFIQGKPSPDLIFWVIFKFHRKYKEEISLATAHNIVAQLLDMDKGEMFASVSQYQADRADPTRKPTVIELRRDPEVWHAYQDAIARMSSKPTFEEFVEGYKKNHLLRRPPTAHPNALGVSHNGRFRYFETDITRLEKLFRKRYIRSVIMAPRARGEQSPLVGASKLGGLADLPPDVDYPVGNDGHPMRLLCQINTADISEGLMWHMPKEGLLSFFCSVDCYQLFTGASHMAAIFTPVDKTLLRKTFEHPKAQPYNENVLSFRLGKTVQLPPWEGGTEMQERLNRDPTLMHKIVDESFDNAQPSYCGYGKHTYMSYMQLGDKQLRGQPLKGRYPLIYLPSYMDVEKTISIGDGGAAAFFTKTQEGITDDDSPIPYAYFAK